jgi:hypothetical protein
MPKPTLQNTLDIKDPMLSDNFDVTFSKLPSAVSDAEKLKFQCKTAIKPGTTIEEVAIELFGHRTMHVGRKTFSNSMQLEFVEDREGKIHENMDKWHTFCRDTKTQHGNYKEEYAGTCEFNIYDQKGEKVKTFTIHNIWPSVVPDMQFDGSSATAISCAVEFKFDYWEDGQAGSGSAA